MAVTVIEGFNLIVFGSVVPLLLKDDSLGVTDQETGLIGGLVYVGALLGSALAPVVAERTGRKRVLVLAVGVFALGAALTGLSVGAGLLAVARLVTGAGVGGALTTAMTVARNCAPARRASLVVAVTMAGIPLGGVAASLLAVPVLPALGWRPMFFAGAAAGLAVLVAVLLTRIPADTPQERAARTWTGRQKLVALFAGRGGVVAAVVAAAAVTNMVAWQGLNVWAADAMTDLGYSLRAALLLTFTLTGAAVVGSFGGAWAADRYGPARVAVGTGVCTVLGLAGAVALPVTPVTTVLCVSLMGIGGHTTMNLVHTTASGIYPLPVRAAALGWSNGTSCVGAFLGPTLGGTAIAAGGADGLFLTFGGAAALCLAAVTGLFLADRACEPGVFRSPPDAGRRRPDGGTPVPAAREAGAPGV
ncbi:MFS transporter [Streptomyces sp. JW3]|uniref:MFS transporter n=1 Tax=Streptomyces sp. JW3 TaxID=3456955 RepID=UPI003FA4CACB